MLQPDDLRWIVPDDERAVLASTFGALLRSERTARGWSLGRLALAVPCDRSTLVKLQAGTRRPSRGMVRAIASVLDPDEPLPLGDRLIEAAGPSLRPDAPGVLARRVRRSNEAIMAGRRPLPSDIQRRVDLHRSASAASRAADALLNTPGALDDGKALRRACHLLDEARRLNNLAGPPITLIFGRRQDQRITFGID